MLLAPIRKSVDSAVKSQAATLSMAAATWVAAKQVAFLVIFRDRICFIYGWKAGSWEAMATLINNIDGDQWFIVCRTESRRGATAWLLNILRRQNESA